MIERFHRQLKSSLKAYNNPSNWTVHLPLIMLAIRCTIKEDIQSTPAGLVYGSTLKLSGGFFHTEQNTSTNDMTSFISRLKLPINKLRATPPRSSSAKKPFISKDLDITSHVFVRRDAIRKPLQAPYDGQSPILSRHRKYFILDLNVRKDSVSRDRLKPAFVETPETPDSSS
ncbi:Uncharacterised protein r2_g3270 [Pycnogonum litorale]